MLSNFSFSRESVSFKSEIGLCDSFDLLSCVRLSSELLMLLISGVELHTFSVEISLGWKDVYDSCIFSKLDSSKEISLS